MGIAQQIDTDLREAMKNRDADKMSALRMLKAAEKNAAIEKKKDRLDDAEMVKLIGKLVKQRRDSIEEFKKGNRPDLVAKEEGEIVILSHYLPKELDMAEIDHMIDAVIKETGASKKSDMGNVMKLVMEKTAGRADGKLISQKVSAKLS